LSRAELLSDAHVEYNMPNRSVADLHLYLSVDPDTLIRTLVFELLQDASFEHLCSHDSLDLLLPAFAPVDFLSIQLLKNPQQHGGCNKEFA
jgi:hypothetical protein